MYLTVCQFIKFEDFFFMGKAKFMQASITLGCWETLEQSETLAFSGILYRCHCYLKRLIFIFFSFFATTNTRPLL